MESGDDELEMTQHSTAEPIWRCPVVGCPSKRAVVRSDLQEDKETKMAIAMKNGK